MDANSSYYQCIGFWIWDANFVQCQSPIQFIGSSCLKTHNRCPLLESTNKELNVYGVFGIANKYLRPNDAVVEFHDDDPCVLKEIKSYLEGNGYEIWSRWVVINIMPQMNNELRGKMVSFCLLSSQSLVDSKHSLSISNVCNFILVDSIELDHSSCPPHGCFQLSGNSPKHGEAWVVVGGG